MKNSGASSNDPKGKRPMAQNELETLESDRVKRIKHEAELRNIPYEDCKTMVAIEETDLVKKQNLEDELLAKALAQQLKEDEADLIKRQVKDDEMLAKVLTQLGESDLPKREESNFLMPSNPQKEEEEDDEDPSILSVTPPKCGIEDVNHIRKQITHYNKRPLK